MLLRLLLEQIDFLDEPRVGLTVRILIIVQIFSLDAEIHFKVIQHILYIRVSLGMLPLLSHSVGHRALGTAGIWNVDRQACQPGPRRRNGVICLVVDFFTPRYDSLEVLPVNRLGLG